MLTYRTIGGLAGAANAWMMNGWQWDWQQIGIGFGVGAAFAVLLFIGCKLVGSVIGSIKSNAGSAVVSQRNPQIAVRINAKKSNLANRIDKITRKNLTDTRKIRLDSILKKSTSSTTKSLSQAPQNSIPNSRHVQIDNSGNIKSVTIFGSEGRPIVRFDYGHSHGGLQPHVHHWRWGEINGELRSIKSWISDIFGGNIMRGVI